MKNRCSLRQTHAHRPIRTKATNINCRPFFIWHRKLEYSITRPSETCKSSEKENTKTTDKHILLSHRIVLQAPKDHVNFDCKCEREWVRDRAMEYSISAISKCQSKFRIDFTVLPWKMCRIHVYILLFYCCCCYCYWVDQRNADNFHSQNCTRNCLFSLRLIFMDSYCSASACNRQYA